MTYNIVNPMLGKPGAQWTPGKQHTPAWIEKALRKGHITLSTPNANKSDKTKTTKRTKGKP